MLRWLSAPHSFCRQILVTSIEGIDQLLRITRILGYFHFGLLGVMLCE